MYKFIITCLLSGTFLLMLSSCNGGNTQSNTEAEENKTENALAKEVMAIHDEAMPMNADLVRLSEELNDQLKNNENLGEAQQMEIKKTIQALVSAEEAMMDWMATYSVKGKSGADLEAYLNEEKEKISTIKTQMEEAFERGKAQVAALSGEKGAEK